MSNLKISRVGNTFTKHLFTDTINIEPVSTALKWDHNTIAANPNLRLYSNSNYLRKLKTDDSISTVLSNTSFILGGDIANWTYVLHDDCNDLIVGIKNNTVEKQFQIVAKEEDIIAFSLTRTSLTITQTRNKRFVIANLNIELATILNETVYSFIRSQKAFSAEINYDQKALIQIKNNQTQFSSNIPIVLMSAFTAKTTYVIGNTEYFIDSQDYFVIIRNETVKKLYLPLVKNNKGRMLIIYREYPTTTNEDPLDPELKIYTESTDTIDNVTILGIPEKGVLSIIGDGVSSWVVN